MANANRLKKDLSTTRPKPIEGQLILEDGSRFNGLKIGSPNMEIGEVCFNTSMTGYQEIITDPSYAGQIINFTFPISFSDFASVAPIASSQAITVSSSPSCFGRNSLIISISLFSF